MMKATPTAEHAFLARFAGEWEPVPPEGRQVGPGDLPWREHSRMLEGLWMVSEASGLTPDGTPGTTLLTIGYDPAQGHFVGTWIGTMMTHLWVYRGWLEEDGATLVLEAEGPDFKDTSRMLTYRDSVTLVGDDRRLFRASVKDAEGDWREFMSAEFRRVN